VREGTRGRGGVSAVALGADGIQAPGCRQRRPEGGMGGAEAGRLSRGRGEGQGPADAAREGGGGEEGAPRPARASDAPRTPGAGAEPSTQSVPGACGIGESPKVWAEESREEGARAREESECGGEAGAARGSPLSLSTLSLYLITRGEPAPRTAAEENHKQVNSIHILPPTLSNNKQSMKCRKEQQTLSLTRPPTPPPGARPPGRGRRRRGARRLPARPPRRAAPPGTGPAAPPARPRPAG